MGRGAHSDDEGTPYDQSLAEMDFLRSACGLAQRGQAQQLGELLLRRPNMLREDGAGGDSGYTPLHYAAREGHVACVEVLLSAGAPINAATRSGGATALHRAAYTGRVEVVRILLASGADALLADSDGETALHKATARGHGAVAGVLESAAPAAATMRDRRGRTPADMA